MPSVLDGCARRWQLTLLPSFANLSYNFVAPVSCADGVPAVLKVCPPDADFAMEVEALQQYDGQGCVRLLAVDEPRGALLLERATPGRLLSTLEDDDAATDILLAVMKRLHRPAPAGIALPTVMEWGRALFDRDTRFPGATSSLPAGLVDRAQRLYRDLAVSSGESVVLHADLHHYNVLSATRAPWLAIDPKGVLGEGEYEVGALVRNPWETMIKRTDRRAVNRRRLDRLADGLGWDRERLRDWAFAQTVLSAVWSTSSGSTASEYAIAVAEELLDA